MRPGTGLWKMLYRYFGFAPSAGISSVKTALKAVAICTCAARVQGCCTDKRNATYIEGIHPVKLSKSNQTIRRKRK